MSETLRQKLESAIDKLVIEAWCDENRSLSDELERNQHEIETSTADMWAGASAGIAAALEVMQEEFRTKYGKPCVMIETEYQKAGYDEALDDLKSFAATLLERPFEHPSTEAEEAMRKLMVKPDRSDKGEG